MFLRRFSFTVVLVKKIGHEKCIKSEVVFSKFCIKSEVATSKSEAMPFAQPHFPFPHTKNQMSRRARTDIYNPHPSICLFLPYYPDRIGRN